VAELGGRAVVVSGSDDATVRVWDLATGAPIGSPFTGQRGAVNAIAVAELGGRPVVVSGGDDRTVRVSDLVTGAPIGSPFTEHKAPVNAVAVTELDGRPVAVSGGKDATVRVWDLATGAPTATPFKVPSGILSVISTAPANFNGTAIRGTRAFIVAGAGDQATVITPPTAETPGEWLVRRTIQFNSKVLGVAWHNPNTLVAATELGIAVLETT
jgi:WD40 repeat protein